MGHSYWHDGTAMQAKGLGVQVVKPLQFNDQTPQTHGMLQHFHSKRENTNVKA
jgi:hypothetical protein